jgi:hypothetical protein
MEHAKNYKKSNVKKSGAMHAMYKTNKVATMSKEHASKKKGY